MSLTEFLNVLKYISLLVLHMYICKYKAQFGKKVTEQV